MTAYNEVFGDDYVITAVARWNESTIEDYVKDITTDDRRFLRQGGKNQQEEISRLLGRRKNKGSGGSGRCKVSCNNEPLPSSQLIYERQLQSGTTKPLDAAVTECLEEAKNAGYLQAYEMGGGVTLTTCVDAVLGEEEGE